MLHDLIFRLRALFRHRLAEDDLQEELQYHLERQSEKMSRPDCNRKKQGARHELLSAARNRLANNVARLEAHGWSRI